ncbi:hypothetical protein ACFE04_022759 [Oxalis oulophora]
MQSQLQPQQQSQQQQQYQQTPVYGYSNILPPPPPAAASSDSSHSSYKNGSFGTVFVVLAVILVISAIACCLGRFCNKSKGQHRHHDKVKPSKKDKHKKGPSGLDNDIEFGFDKRIAAGKPSGMRDSDMRLPPPPGRGTFKMPGNGDLEFKPGPMHM